MNKPSVQSTSNGSSKTAAPAPKTSSQQSALMSPRRETESEHAPATLDHHAASKSGPRDEPKVESKEEAKAESKSHVRKPEILAMPVLPIVSADFPLSFFATFAKAGSEAIQRYQAMFERSTQRYYSAVNAYLEAYRGDLSAPTDEYELSRADTTDRANRPTERSPVHGSHRPAVGAAKQETKGAGHRA